MDYITSRGHLLPKEISEFEADLRFHLWQKKLWPYEELVIGDVLYWYETPSQSIVWKSKVIDVDRFPYNNKLEVSQRLSTRFHVFDINQSYFLNGPEHGYCLALKVKALERVYLLKPANIRFPQQGWMKIDSGIVSHWLPDIDLDNDVVLDDLVPRGSLIEEIQKLNKNMMGVSPERIESIISHTIRKDTKMVKAMKALCEYKCQFPNCDAQIIKRNGGLYIEMAHIRPISQDGLSVLGNLLVLCPNHHKEFDYGNLEITEQTEFLVEGHLNNKAFRILFPGISKKG